MKVFSSLIVSTVLVGAAVSAAHAAPAAPATFTIKQLTLETAQRAAQAALDKCRKDGAQVAVAVVDRGGNTQVMLRDRFAGAHTPETAANKAWTSVSFKISTTELGKETEPNKPSSGIRHIARVVTVGGGLMIEAGGALLGGIGVSGAPGGAMDETCAQAGIKAIADDLEF
jgi:uncharacterized protein GlcG (DUF336 family)